jgi:hypothetical protein
MENYLSLLSNSEMDGKTRVSIESMEETGSLCTRGQVAWLTALYQDREWVKSA